MKTNIDNMTAKINLMENAVYIVKDGLLTKVSPKSYGEDLIIWKNGSVLDINRSERVRINGQDVI